MSLLNSGHSEVPGNVVTDPHNDQLQVRPATLTTARGLVVGAGNRCFVTFRTETTTLTLIIDKTTALSWAAQIKAEADGLSSSGLVTGG